MGFVEIGQNRLRYGAGSFPVSATSVVRFSHLTNAETRASLNGFLQGLFARTNNQLAGLLFDNCHLSHVEINAHGLQLGASGLAFNQCTLERSRLNFSDLTLDGGNLSLLETKGSPAYLDFTNASLSTGNLSINISELNHSELKFDQIDLGGGRGEFVSANINGSMVSFQGCKQNDGEFFFSLAAVKASKFDLQNMTLNDVELDLSRCNLQDRSAIDLDGSTLGKTISNFKSARLARSKLSLQNCEILSGDIDCSEASFTNSSFHAEHLKAPQSNLLFNDCQLSASSLDFGSASFGGDLVDFSRLRVSTSENTSSKSTLKLSGLSFEGRRFAINGDFENATLVADDLDITSEQFSMSGLSMSGSGLLSLSGSNIKSQHVNFYTLDASAAEIDYSETLFVGTIFIANKSKLDADLISFAEAAFDFKEIFFSDTQWSGTRLDFEGAAFSGKSLKFDRNEFGCSFTDFSNSTLSSETTVFDNSKFGGRASFSDVNGVVNARHFSFRHCVFENSFDLSSDDEFGCVVDLTRTKMTNQFSLENVRCKINSEPDATVFERILQRFEWYLHEDQINDLLKRYRSWEWLSKQRVIDPKDVERLRRLKQIAGDNKNNRQAVDYRVKETKAERWNGASTADHFFEFFFQKLSDYGRSEMRVLAWLGVTIVAFAWIYASVKRTTVEGWDLVTASITYSLSQTLAFLPVSRTSRLDYADILFGENAALPLSVVWIASAQNLISVLLLFLFGLALRNRFRV
ncbi:MAG: hypothetical protein AAGG69_13415 [Pseudomonadota bacterium]